MGFDSDFWGEHCAELRKILSALGEASFDVPEQAKTDELDAYLDSLVDSLVLKFQVEPEEAMDMLMDCAEALAADGKLPPFPEDDAPHSEEIEWLSKAQGLGLSDKVLEVAEHARAEAAAEGQ
jgi:hypothetical protein